MSKCIDVFYTPNRRAYTYITFVIDDNGAVITSRTHQEIETVAEWCKRQQLPARSNSDLVQEELRQYGVDVESQALGVGEPTISDHYDVNILLHREQANFLRQFLTTIREWVEGGRSMSMIHYLFAAHALWLDEFDQRLASSLRQSSRPVVTQGSEEASSEPLDEDEEDCQVCHGTGICPKCGGVGWLSNNEKCDCNDGLCWCGTPVIYREKQRGNQHREVPHAEQEMK